MTQPNIPTSRVVIVGGGVAGLEALLALRALLDDRINLTLVSPQDAFVDRPMSVAEPFGLSAPARHSLTEIADECDAEFVRAAVTGVDAAARRVSCADGTDLEYERLILAGGAQTRPPFFDAITFGLEGSDRAIREMLDRLRSGEAHSVSFVAPTLTGWLLPLYELALMTARELARSGVEGVQLNVLSAEERPLGLFGAEASQSVARLLGAAGVEFVRAHFAKDSAGRLVYGAIGESRPDYVVTLPVLEGPALPGVPATGPHGFIPVDEHGRVAGLADVYAAGDAVDFPVKQGGLAAQQADAVAEHIAADHGAAIEPAPFRPVLRGMVFTGDESHYMRSKVPGPDPHVADAWYPLWWPPTKVAGRYLAPYLFGRVDEAGFAGSPIGFVDVDIPLSAVTLPG
ncbi:MAG TPA: FAD/NAD(P)-binding oxidoreductase [Solirubrobacteraceae bacterium]|nr:FAD/NAD(P)-binding oxidoreductase [Solirubrobacteraceae bacterium]